MINGMSREVPATCLRIRDNISLLHNTFVIFLSHYNISIFLGKITLFLVLSSVIMSCSIQFSFYVIQSISKEKSVDIYLYSIKACSHITKKINLEFSRFILLLYLLGGVAVKKKSLI